MNSIRRIALSLLFIYFSAYVNSASFVMHITCGPCTISCEFSNCYIAKATDDNYSEEICSTSDCISSFN